MTTKHETDIGYIGTRIDELRLGQEKGFEAINAKLEKLLTPAVRR